MEQGRAYVIDCPTNRSNQGSSRSLYLCLPCLYYYVFCAIQKMLQHGVSPFGISSPLYFLYDSTKCTYSKGFFSIQSIQVKWYFLPLEISLPFLSIRLRSAAVSLLSFNAGMRRPFVARLSFTLLYYSLFACITSGGAGGYFLLREREFPVFSGESYTGLDQNSCG